MQEYDLVIAGAGPAGLAVAQRVSAAGYRVCIIDPDPLAAWPNNYGVWVDEFQVEHWLLPLTRAQALLAFCTLACRRGSCFGRQTSDAIAATSSCAWRGFPETHACNEVSVFRTLTTPQVAPPRQPGESQMLGMYMPKSCPHLATCHAQAMGLEDYLEVVWPRANVHLGSGPDDEKFLTRPYGRVDRPKLKRMLLQRCIDSGVIFHVDKVCKNRQLHVRSLILLPAGCSAAPHLMCLLQCVVCHPAESSTMPVHAIVRGFSFYPRVPARWRA